MKTDLAENDENKTEDCKTPTSFPPHTHLVGVGVRHGLGGVDGLVEERVGEGGVVELVVAVAAVAHQVEEDVAAELALVLQAELRRLHHVLVGNNSRN